MSVLLFVVERGHSYDFETDWSHPYATLHSLFLGYVGECWPVRPLRQTEIRLQSALLSRGNHILRQPHLSPLSVADTLPQGSCKPALHTTPAPRAGA